MDLPAVSSLTTPEIAPGPPLIILLNIGSGSREKEEAERQILGVLQAGGRAATVVRLFPPSRIPALLDKAAKQAKATGAILVAAGGDGTINSVAGQCYRHHLPMGIIPLGTFNYYARALGIPLEPVEAVAVLLSGRMRPVDVGFVNDRMFLNNASFGLYSRLIRNREEDKSRFGRFRLVAIASAIKTVISGRRPFAIRLIAPESVQLRRTEMVYVCNNPVQLENIGVPMTRCIETGCLAVLILKPLKRLSMLRLFWNGLIRNLGEDDRLETFCTKHLSVETRRRSMDVVVDGEVIRCQTPLSFRVARQALQVVVPAAAPSAS